MLLRTLSPQPMHTCRLQSGLRPAGITSIPSPSDSICHRGGQRASGLRRPQLIVTRRKGVRTEKKEERGGVGAAGGAWQLACDP